MHKLIIVLLVLSSCTLPDEKKDEAVLPIEKDSSTHMEVSDANTAAVDTPDNNALPRIKKIPTPAGIYQALVPTGGGIEQTIAFNSDLTYRLEERYPEKKDSVVTTEGTWMPSDGYIWLYKDQIVRGRYKWKGDVLEYYSPLLKNLFAMKHLRDAAQNAGLTDTSRAGIVVLGTGTEPFWKLEVTKKDTLSFLLPEWKHPVSLRRDSTFAHGDSTVYTARNDSVDLRVTVIPHFCRDGMSDLTYRNRVRVQYNHQVYTGCGSTYPR